MVRSVVGRFIDSVRPIFLSLEVTFQGPTVNDIHSHILNLLEPSKSHYDHFWPNMSEEIDIDQIKTAFAPNSQENTNADVKELSEKLMKMIREQNKDYQNQQRYFGIFGFCYAAVLLSLAIDHVL